MRKRALDTLSREEIQTMEKAANTEREKLVVRGLSDTGMRLGELLTLRAPDIRSEGGRHVIKVLGEGDRERLIPIQPALARRLRRFADRSHQDSKQLGPHKESAVEQMICNLAEVAGIEKRVFPHLLRDRLPPRGGNSILLQQILGHSSLAMITQTYQHLTFTDAHTS